MPEQPAETYCPDYAAYPPPPDHDVANTSYNALIVGGVNDCGTVDHADDVMYWRQWSRNTGGRELPHILAPSVRIDSDEYLGLEACSGGTSFSTPMVAGVAAGLLAEFPELSGWPEGMRSVLMAGAYGIENGPLDLTDATDDRDGTGEVDALASLFTASAKVNGGNSPLWTAFDAGSMRSSTTPAGSIYAEQYHALHVVNGGSLRVVLSWDSKATCTYPDLSYASCASDLIDADLDLFVFNHDTFVLEGSSTSVANNYEVVEFKTSPGQQYDIWIQAYSWNSAGTRFGIAWFQGDLGD